MALVVKNLPANAGVRDVRDEGSIPGSGKSPGGGHGNPLQYSCLENPMDRGNWWATVHRVAESQTQLSSLVCTRVGNRGGHNSQETSADGTWVRPDQSRGQSSSMPQTKMLAEFQGTDVQGSQ